MGGTLGARLFGLLALFVAGATFWLAVLGPLEAMRAQEDHVRYSLGAFVLIGFAAVFGLFFLLFGGSVPYRNAERQTPTGAGWVLLALSLALTGALYWWAKGQFEALGYAYSGADPSHPQQVMPFVYPSPPPVARPTYGEPAVPGSPGRN